MIKVVQYGFGSLGKEIFQAFIENNDFKIQAVIDNEKSKAEQDLRVLSPKKEKRIRIFQRIDEIKSKPDIVIHATTSDINQAYYQFCLIAKKRTPIISTCEELVYPISKNKGIAKKIDSLAKRYNFPILGVGINPGFLMDSLVIVLSSLCTKINKIKVKRMVNVAKRRKSLQKKMGVGLTKTEFYKIKNKIGHVGLTESASMICDTLNAKVSYQTKITPIIAKKGINSNGIYISKGHVCGIKHILIAKKNNFKFLEMDLTMSVGQDEYDLVNIDGKPPVCLKTNGVMGDKSTVALLLNYISVLLKAKPGLHTVNDLLFPGYHSEN